MEDNTEQKNKVGRPSEYNEDVLEKTKAYIDSCEDEEFDWTKSQGKESESWEHRTKVKLPTIEGLALYLGVMRDTIYNWEKQYNEFSCIIGQLRAKQADMLISKGLSGDYNPTIAKVLLSKHGYREGIEQTGKDGIPLIPKEKRDEIESAIDEVL